MSEDTEIAGRWEFIETSQYRVHRGKNGKKYKSKEHMTNTRKTNLKQDGA